MQQQVFTSLTAEELSSIVKQAVREEISRLDLTPHQPEPEETLLTRKQVLEMFDIHASTLVKWQNEGRIKVYKMKSKNFYKRSEVMASLIEKQA